MTGKKRVVSSGTEQVSVAEPPPFTPVRNHIEPRCAIMHLSPVVSSNGFTEIGIDRAHCHHSPVSTGRGGRLSSLSSLSAKAICAGIVSPKTMAMIAKVVFMRFMVSSLSNERILLRSVSVGGRSA